MKALVVFHDYGHGALCRPLKRGFRHVFAAVDDGVYWIRLDGQAGMPSIEAVAPAGYDLAAFYRDQGFTVVETAQAPTAPTAPLAIANCVGFVKAILCLRAPFVWTPYQLFKHLVRR